MIRIKEIELKSVYAIRHKVLRKGKPIEACQFIDDEKETTKHLGILLDNNVVGVVSLFKQKSRFFNEEIQFQIRGMAVLEEHQHSGFGKELIFKVEEYCLQSNADLIWFNARETAKIFYEKLNYIAFDEPFEIENIGLHYIMFKKLN